MCWFWELLPELSEEQQRLLLRFSTGSGRVPPGGFRALEPRFTLEVSGAGSREHLPHAHTCVNKLVLHRWESSVYVREGWWGLGWRWVLGKMGSALLLLINTTIV